MPAGLTEAPATGRGDQSVHAPAWNQGGPPARVRRPRLAAEWLHATRPDTGEECVFKPGELLPDWVTTPDDNP